MKIKTRNSLYKLEDQGDGAFLITGDNPNYAGNVPYLCRLLVEPVIGSHLVVYPINGFRPGRTWVSSTILEVNL